MSISLEPEEGFGERERERPAGDRTLGGAPASRASDCGAGVYQGYASVFPLPLLLCRSLDGSLREDIS
jgi:hypothetical protein